MYAWVTAERDAKQTLPQLTVFTTLGAHQFWCVCKIVLSGCMSFTLFLLTVLGMRMHPQIHLPIGFGGCYEDHWPLHLGEHSHDPFYYPHSYYYPRYPYRRPPPRIKPNEFTLSQKTDCIRHELSIPNNVSMSEAISRANAIMGMKSKGSLATQIEELMIQLAH